MTNLIIGEDTLQRVTIKVRRKGGNTLDEVVFILGVGARLEIESSNVARIPDGERNELVSFTKAQQVIAKHVAKRLKG